MPCDRSSTPPTCAGSGSPTPTSTTSAPSPCCWPRTRTCGSSPRSSASASWACSTRCRWIGCTSINPGETITLADRTLTAVSPPAFDNPITVGFHDDRTDTLFSLGLLRSAARRDPRGRGRPLRGRAAPRPGRCGRRSTRHGSTRPIRRSSPATSTRIRAHRAVDGAAAATSPRRRVAMLDLFLGSVAAVPDRRSLRRTGPSGARADARRHGPRPRLTAGPAVRPRGTRRGPSRVTRKGPLTWDSRWWRGQDLNLRPSGYEPDELPDCSTPRRTGDPTGGPSAMPTR